MHSQISSPVGGHRILLVAPVPPPYGGMALQAQMLRKRIEGDGHSVTLFPSNFPFPQGFSWLGSLLGVRTVARGVMIGLALAVRVRQVNIVHILAASWFYFFAVVYPAVIVGRLSRKRVIINFRGGDARRFLQSWGWLARPAFRMASAVTAPSNFLARVIQEEVGVSVEIVPNIVDISLFRFKRRESFAPSFLVTRHLEKMYDIESVLKAFQSVQAEFPGAGLTIAGTGSEEQALRRFVQDAHLANVAFLGHVPQKDLAEIYSSHDIYINASRIDNFPGALIEASAAGIVIVSTGAGGIPTIYEHETNALLVEPGDWQGLADCAKRVLQSPALGRELTERAAVLAASCDWLQVRTPLYRVYEPSGRKPAEALSAA